MILKIELESSEMVLIQTALMDKSRRCMVELETLWSMDETKDTAYLVSYWGIRYMQCKNLCLAIGERWRIERDKPPRSNRGVNSNFGVDQDV